MLEAHHLLVDRHAGMHSVSETSCAAALAAAACSSTCHSSLGVTTLRLGSYRGLDSSPYGVPRGNQSETRPVYLVYFYKA